MKEKVFCKQLYYKFPDREKHTILLGIVEKEDNSFIYFRTRNRRYQFNKSLILQINETREEFIEESEEGGENDGEY
jgi:hypothetical protein